MPRLNIERQNEKEPERMEYAIEQLHKAGIENMVVIDNKEIEFYLEGSMIRFYPYSGWHTGKSIKDGRGIEKLLKQIKP